MDKEIPCCQLTGRPDDARKTLIGIAFINDVVNLFEDNRTRVFFDIGEKDVA